MWPHRGGGQISHEKMDGNGGGCVAVWLDVGPAGKSSPSGVAVAAFVIVFARLCP